jgi:pimeloyl-ACP methyl ester carboxylesterase
MLRDLKRTVCSALAAAVLAAGILAAADSTFDSAGVRIHFTDEGSGEPVLLIHGYTVDAVRQWGDPGIIKGLADRYRVITFDHRGHGQSGKPHDPRAYGNQMAEDAVRLLDHLNIRKAHIVGYSMGGFLTVDLLTMHPDRFLTATMGGAGARLGDGATLNQIAESLEQGKGIGPLVVALTPPGEQPPPPDQVDAISKMILAGNDPLALAAVSRSLTAVHPSDAKIRSNRVPALALIGEADPLKPGVDALDGVMPNLKIVVIPKANHINAPADPLFLKTLRAFLEEHPYRRAATSAAGR